jgi:hypothetical protein
MYEDIRDASGEVEEKRREGETDDIKEELSRRVGHELSDDVELLFMGQHGNLAEVWFGVVWSACGGGHGFGGFERVVAG